MKNFLIIFLSFVTFQVNAEETKSLEKYYSNIYLGEKNTTNYAGPKDARTKFSPEQGKEVFLDDIFNEKLLNENLQPDAFDLQKFWFNKVLDKSTCPDEELGEHYDYIRYLFRLVTMSYLFESLKINHRIVSELNLPRNSCNLSFNEIYGNCSPISDDMNKFKERVYGKFVNEFEKVKYSSLSNKEIESWMELFHLSTGASADPSFARLHLWCENNHKNCKNLTIAELKSALDGFCEHDKKMMGMLCNERDQLYGMSYVSTVNELVKKSNAFNLINVRGMGEDCLRRFVRSNANREVVYNDLNMQFISIQKYLESEKSTYLQGALFLPGALKEFDMKGLSDFLVALKPPKVEVIKVAKAKPKIISKPKQKIEKKIETKKIEPAPVVIVEPEAPKVSEFERAVLELNNKNVTRVVLDMDKFREDFEFTSKMISNLSIPLKKFQTRQALKDMKDYDHFGQVDAPVGVVFIKFLIDTDNHQGLYNVINVLGDKFYLANDFEGKTLPVYCELKNDASTKNRWQINLLKNTK